jgi:5-hydroxyisourate hydrolase-like protein (transthyretin family)
MDFDFLRRKGETYALVASTKTDEDGRTAKPLMAGEAFRSVSDRIVFHVAADDRHLHLRAGKRALRLPLHHRDGRAQTR